MVSLVTETATTETDTFAVGATIASITGPHATGEIATITSAKPISFFSGQVLPLFAYVTTDGREGDFFACTNVRGWTVVEPPASPELVARYTSILETAVTAREAATR